MSRPLTIAEALARAKKAVRQGRNDVAIKLFAAILQQDPKHPVARKALRKLQRQAPRKSAGPGQEQINALINLYGTGRLGEAEASCRELLRGAPESVLVLNILGSILQGQGRLQEAVAAFDEAIRVKPDFAEAHGNRGNALKGLERLDDALAAYERALELRPDYADAWYNRGNMLKDHGRLEDAIANYEEAIRLNPEFAQAHRNVSALKSYAANDPQVELMESLLEKPGLHEAARAEICFALAKACEDQGDVDRCFDYLQQGNDQRKAQLGYDIQEDRKLFARIRELEGNGVEAVSVTAEASIQPVFVVGMMRSGTSLVEQILASHGDVYGAGELEALNQLIVPQLSLINAAAIREGYIDALAALGVSEKVITDKMPLNFRWIGLILAALPEARIIHVERDPRATCWSIYKHYFADEGNAYAYSMQDVAEYYGLYRDLMAIWREKYADRIYDLRYEDLTENQEQETRKLLEFCGLEWQEQCLDFHRTRRAVKTMSATQVRRKMYTGSSEAWRDYEQHLKPLLDGLKQRHELV